MAVRKEWYEKCTSSKFSLPKEAKQKKIPIKITKIDMYVILYTENGKNCSYPRTFEFCDYEFTNRERLAAFADYSDEIIKKLSKILLAT